MNLQVGQIFEKEGNTFCLIELLNLDGKDYALFSVESSKISYIIYEINTTDQGYNLIAVTDDSLNNRLMSIFEEKNEDEE